MDDKKNKIVVGTVIGIVVVFILVLIIVKSTQTNCNPAEAKPVSDLNKAANITSGDLKSMTSFVGYLQYLSNAKPVGFVALAGNTAKTIHTSAKDKQPETLAINADCATITLSLSRASNQDLKVDKITVELVQASNDIKVCYVRTPNIQTPSGKHYSCKIEKTYDCVSEKEAKDGKKEVETIANLVLQKLEFEVDTKEEDAKKGKFSTDYESCK